jgi:phosphoribosylanthranilate isomerase
VPFTLLPALDLSGGWVSGPNVGDPIAGDPLAKALAWQAAGAAWVHLVDLDAVFGRGDNAELLAQLVARLDLKAQLSGIADAAGLARALATGCERVVLGTAALADLDWCCETIGRYGERIAVGLDVDSNGDGYRLLARGDAHDAGPLAAALTLLEHAGCARYVVTDISRDGRRTGPNVDLLRTVCAQVHAPVLASGGVASREDLATLASLGGIGVEGAVVGTALHVGAFTLREALETVGAI